MVKISNSIGNLITHIKLNANPGWSIEERLNYSIWKMEKEDLIKACKYVNPQLPVKSIVPYFPPFTNWFDFMRFHAEDIRSTINEILILQDCIDNDLFEWLTYLRSSLYLLERERRKPANTDLETWSGDIFEVAANTIFLVDTFDKNYKKYQFEHHTKHKMRDVRKWYSN